MKRAHKYFKREKEIHIIVVELRKLYISLFTGASFPDSGYYYKQKEKDAYNLECMLNARCPKKVDKYIASCIKSGEEAGHNYHYKVVEVGSDGREYTASDMDDMMVNGH